MLLKPLIALRPDIALLYIKRLFFNRFLAGNQFRPSPADGGEEPVPDEEIDDEKKRPSHNQGENPLPLIHAFKPCRHHRHRGFPSNRNCAWLLGKMRGSAMVN